MFLDVVWCIQEHSGMLQFPLCYTWKLHSTIVISPGLCGVAFIPTSHWVLRWKDASMGGGPKDRGRLGWYSVGHSRIRCRTSRREQADQTWHLADWKLSFGYPSFWGGLVVSVCNACLGPCCILFTDHYHIYMDRDIHRSTHAVDVACVCRCLPPSFICWLLSHAMPGHPKCGCHHSFGGFLEVWPNRSGPNCRGSLEFSHRRLQRESRFL